MKKRQGDRETSGRGDHAPAGSSHLVTLSPPHLVTSILLHLILSASALLILLPFLWLACAAFKPQRDIFATAFLPWGRLGDLTLDNFRILFRREPFAQWMLNSLFLSSLQTVLVVTLSSLAGSRWRSTGSPAAGRSCCSCLSRCSCPRR